MKLHTMIAFRADDTIAFAIEFDLLSPVTPRKLKKFLKSGAGVVRIQRLTTIEITPCST